MSDSKNEFWERQLKDIDFSGSSVQEKPASTPAVDETRDQFKEAKFSLIPYEDFFHKLADDIVNGRQRPQNLSRSGGTFEFEVDGKPIKLTVRQTNTQWLCDVVKIGKCGKTTEEEIKFDSDGHIERIKLTDGGTNYSSDPRAKEFLRLTEPLRRLFEYDINSNRSLPNITLSFEKPSIFHPSRMNIILPNSDTYHYFSDEKGNLSIAKASLAQIVRTAIDAMLPPSFLEAIKKF